MISWEIASLPLRHFQTKGFALLLGHDIYSIAFSHSDNPGGVVRFILEGIWRGPNEPTEWWERLAKRCVQTGIGTLTKLLASRLV